MVTDKYAAVFNLGDAAETIHLNWTDVGIQVANPPCAICGSTRIWAAKRISMSRYAHTLQRSIAYPVNTNLRYEGFLNLR